LDAKSDLQKNRTEPAVFFKTEPKPKPNRTRGFYQNRTETELEKSIPHIPNKLMTNSVANFD